MQFLAPTFEAHAVDADGDGTTNPHDIDDAAATAANHICQSAAGRVTGLEEIGRIYNPGGGSAYVAALQAEHQRIHASPTRSGANMDTPGLPPKAWRASLCGVE
jgi:membrane-bound lytic murein transglycosylase B